MVIRLNVGRYATNAYIYYNQTSLQGVVIDPAGDADKILNKIESTGLSIQAVLLTHGHFDHTGAVNEIRDALKTKVYASKHDAELANNPDANGAAFFGIPHNSVVIDKTITQEGERNFGELKIQVLTTPGHTAGCLCFYIPDQKIIFSGDTLFKESYGRHDLPTSDFPALLGSLQRLLDLPPDTVVYPGHGQSTTIAYEREHNLIKRK